MAKKKKEEDVGILERKIVDAHIDKLEGEVIKAVQELEKDLNTAFDKFEKVTKKHNLNIDQKTIRINGTQVAMGFRFRTDREWLYRKNRVKAIQEHMNNI